MKDSNGNEIKVPKTCKYCGEVFDASLRYSDVDKQEDECFTCWHWRDWLEKDKTDPDSIVVQGHHYHIGEEPKKDTDKWKLGFGGSEHRIIRNTGKLVISHNLWHQGEITEYWRQFFPDNAVFLPYESWSRK